VLSFGLFLGAVDEGPSIPLEAEPALSVTILRGMELEHLEDYRRKSNVRPDRECQANSNEEKGMSLGL
jgi:hypothetical protein